MTHKFRIPHYFARSISEEIEELYASTAIADLALALVLLFEPIYLYSVLGLSIPQVLLFTAAVYGCNLFLIPLGAKFASRFGYYHSIAASIPFQVLYWVLLFGSQNYPHLLYFAPLAFSLEKSLYWPAFHASVSRFANKKQRSREFSMLYAIMNVVYVIGPFIGGMISENFGVRIAFVVASCLYACSALPLFFKREEFKPKIYQFKLTWELYKTYPKRFLGYMGFGEELLVLTVWPIFIYTVVSNYADAGILTTVSTLVATLLALYLGKVSDQSDKSLLIKVGALFTFMVWLSRFVAKTFWGVFAIDSLSRTSKEVFFIPLSALTYERANDSHIMAYAVFYEQSLSVGKLLASLLGIVIFAFTGSFMALFILAALFSLLYLLE